MTRGKTQDERHLDQDEREMVRLSQAPETLEDEAVLGLLKRLRSRRDRVQRMIRARTRVRAEGVGPDTGAREKKAVLVAAIDRVNEDWRGRQSDIQRRTATDHLRQAVVRKAENPSWTGPDDQTAHDGMASHPNVKIAPSGALHAEGMRAAISRSTGDR